MSDRCSFCGRFPGLGTFGLSCDRCDHEDDVLELQERIKRLETALECIRDDDWVTTLPDPMDAVRAIAREALE